MKEHRFNEATVTLLTAVTGVSPDTLRSVRVRHRRHNWLHAPWYPAAQGGGALTVGHLIHVTPTHDPDALGQDPRKWLYWILLMAHEVGHVRQAQRFGTGAWARIRFTLWASRNYAVSFVRNGSAAHAKAPFEVDADLGRKRLRNLLERTGGCHPEHPLVTMLMRDAVQPLQDWLRHHRVDLGKPS